MSRRQFMYRGQMPLSQGGVTINPGDVLDEYHPAVVQGWPKIYPIAGDAGGVPEVEESVSMEVDEPETFAE